MRCLTEFGKITTDVDSLRSEIRDKSVRVIDVRREDDYKQDHIPTAVNLPLANLLSDDSPERVLKLINTMGIDNETPGVVQDNSGVPCYQSRLHHLAVLHFLNNQRLLKYLVVNSESVRYVVFQES